ncbi:hypothetical protein HJB52_14225 [Rhizobium lentis]|uniref:hypothetical protein n=1 Tax=Rhizobium lentis TaxID=1138194 RepID=UPI001C83046A|nr:hypothetical protein [Rhizobium lentis]MBX5103029.1 hypothetical protein [Rhizobium lentis]
MNGITIGAVGAAVIAGLVSLLGLIIGKEQKVSEFRQAWIDELRKCLVAYLVNINAVADTVRLKKAGTPLDNSALLGSYKLLNEASHGIKLRINSAEAPAQALLKSMAEFDRLAGDNASLTPDKIRDVETRFTQAAKELLKFEWNRVKQGEKIFIWTKRIVSVTTVVMIFIFFYVWATSEKTEEKQKDQLGFHWLQL